MCALEHGYYTPYYYKENTITCKRFAQFKSLGFDLIRFSVIRFFSPFADINFPLPQTKKKGKKDSKRICNRKTELEQKEQGKNAP